MGIAVCCKNFNNAITDFNYGYIEGTAAKVVYQNLLLFLIIKSISKCCCCRLVDDTLYIQTGNLTCILCCLTLCVIEVCRYRDNRFCYTLTQIVLNAKKNN